MRLNKHLPGSAPAALTSAIQAILIASAVSATPAMAQSGANITIVGPISGITVTSRSYPALGDIDGDGTPEAVIGKEDGRLHYFRSNGTAEAPSYTDQGSFLNPFDLVEVDTFAGPTLADVDGDGDLDLVIGSGGDGELAYYENTGTSSAPVFEERTGEASPFSGINVYYGAPTFVDLDGDGDLDLVVGDYDGDVRYFENTGSKTAPEFTERTGEESPFSAISAGSYAVAAFSDLDGDGDVDMVLGGLDGTLRYFENTGGRRTPAFTELTGDQNPLAGLTTGTFSSPTAVDFDDDGDIDIVVGGGEGAVTLVRNNTDRPAQNNSFGGPGGGGSMGLLGLLGFAPLLGRLMRRKRV